MSSSSNNSSIKWSELPKELVENIGKHLESRIDVFRFRAVSKLWRSIVSLSYLHSPPTPLNLPPPISTPAVFSRFTICRLEDASRTSACLVKVVDSSSANLHLLHPLNSPVTTHFQVSSSSSSSTSKSISININMLDFRLIELTKGFSLESKRRLTDFKIKKVVLFSTLGIIFLFDSGKLWYLKFGDEEDWLHLGSQTTQYDDVMVFKGKYYVIDNLGIIFWIDDRSMNFVQYAPPLCGFGHVKHLVESQGEFYVVDCYLEEDEVGAGGVHPEINVINHHRRCRRVGFKVYRLDEEWGTWVDVKSLGDRVFVLGKEVCYSVSVKDFPGCPGDCIYFVDPRLEDRNVALEVKRLVIRVFRLDNGTIRTMDCFPAYKRLFSQPVYWPLPTLSSP